MDKIEKLLAKLSEEECQKIKLSLSKLGSGDFADLDIKKLKDRTGIFRLRIWNLRVIYRSVKENITVLAITGRNEKNIQI